MLIQVNSGLRTVYCLLNCNHASICTHYNYTAALSAYSKAAHRFTAVWVTSHHLFNTHSSTKLRLHYFTVFFVWGGSSKVECKHVTFVCRLQCVCSVWKWWQQWQRRRNTRQIESGRRRKCCCILKLNWRTQCCCSYVLLNRRHVYMVYKTDVFAHRRSMETFCLL